ncbi:hypothetical protein BT96DRAFT_976239 [Gymnopus androsaceus JB14]|uniref:Uncharacterized protein n=1 Tax=Gymnopus androsaceus JB14 TaxID=1447944 RepID=A0A6A4HM80_9AGAR|nr:hypothetical protein BT96DRAFT_976239 [Gymnopus androsaceus JB14]
MHSQEYKKKVHYKNPSTWDINLRRIISINISLSSFQMSYVEQESGYLCFEIQEYQELDSQMPGRMRDWSLYYRDPVCEETSAYDCSPLDQNPYYNGTDNNQDSISDLRVLEPAVHGDPSTALGFSPRTIFSEDHTTLFEGLGDEERGTDTSSIDSMIWKLPGVDSEPGSASGASRPSTPALSFSSSRYSSRPPSTYSLCDSSSIIDHITYVDPFPHCPETEVSPSYGSEAFVENVYSASLIGDRCGIDIYSHLFSPASNIPFDIDTYSSDCVNTLSSGLLIHPASHQGNLDYIVSECRSSPLSPCSSSLPLPSRDVNWSDYSSNDDNHQRTATYQTPRNEFPTRPKPKRIRGRKPMCQDSDHDYEDLDDGENG